MLLSNILFTKYFNALIILGTLGFFCVYCQKDLAVGKEINRTAKIIKTMVSFFFPSFSEPKPLGVFNIRLWWLAWSMLPAVSLERNLWTTLVSSTVITNTGSSFSMISQTEIWLYSQKQHFILKIRYYSFLWRKMHLFIK